MSICRRGLARTTACGVFVALLLLSPSNIFRSGAMLGTALGAPNDFDRARKIFERGRELYGEGRYSEALAAFLQAYKIQPLPGLLFNAALAAHKANQLARAHELLQSY